jgi:tRNA 2-thiouridine synthesizing protein A
VNPASDRVDPIEVDARGLRCPLPVIWLAQAARDAPAGTCIVVLASDPAARYDIPAWCRMRDHELRELTEVSEITAVSDSSGKNGPPAESAHSGYLRFVVLVRAQPSKAGGTGSGSERSSRAM